MMKTSSLQESKLTIVELGTVGACACSCLSAPACTQDFNQVAKPGDAFTLASSAWIHTVTMGDDGKQRRISAREGAKKQRNQAQSQARKAKWAGSHDQCPELPPPNFPAHHPTTVPASNLAQHAIVNNISYSSSAAST